MAIVPSTNLVTWQGNVGVSGGIPTNGVQYGSTLNPAGGGSDDQPAIQTALNAASTQYGISGTVQIVQLAAGAWRLNGTDLTAVNGVILRGTLSGATKSTVFTIPSGAQIQVRNSPYDPSGSGSTNSALTTNATKGSTTIVVADASWVSVNDLIVISQLDDTSFVNPAGESDSTAQSYVYPGTYGLGQTCKVTGKASNTLTIEVPLYWDYTTTLSAKISKVMTAGRRLFGVEDIKFVRSTDVDTQFFAFDTVENCWLKNVEVSNIGRNGVLCYVCYRCEFRHCTFTGGALLGAGQGYGFALYNYTSACLVEDNIATACHAAYITDLAPAGNVFGYNFEDLSIADSHQSPALATHGYHSLMNLAEGNYFNSKILCDNTHGSGSSTTMLRNRILGYSSTDHSYDNSAVHIYKWNRNCNLVGNILGKVSWQTTTQTWYPTSYDPNTDKVVIRGGDNAAGTGSGAGGDSLATSNPIIEGNWDSVSGTVTWNITPEAIPDSYYYSTTPAIFVGTGLAWPVYTSSMGNSATAQMIPAGYRYYNGGVDPVGSTQTSAMNGVAKIVGKATIK